jgi:hypothetical protein
MPPIITVDDPAMIVSGGPVQVAISPTTAAGMPPINTVGLPGPVTGPPTCGTVPVTIGHTCMSVTLAAGSPIFLALDVFHIYLVKGHLSMVSVIRDYHPSITNYQLSLSAPVILLPPA